MPTSTQAFVDFVNSQVVIAWAWILAVIGALFIYALATGLLGRAIRSVLRHAKGLARL